MNSCPSESTSLSPPATCAKPLTQPKTAITLLGYEPANPADNNGDDRANLRMLTQCDGVLLAPNWETNPMSALATTVAQHLNIPVGTYDHWATRPATGGQR